MTPVCAILDVGKSHTKLSLVDGNGEILENNVTATPSLADAPQYPALGVDGIFKWFCAELREYSKSCSINHLMPVTHGAAAALVDEEGELVMPVMDYEAAIPGEICNEYETLRPGFSETLSPALPMGLNLGRQLYWQSRLDPARFRRVHRILPYPQYWAYRFSGKPACEVTSLGCHSDLWQPESNRPSTLCVSRGWSSKLPEPAPAWKVAGAVTPELAGRTGLARDCAVHVGVHDTNAALFYLSGNHDSHAGGQPPAVLSTGTWFVAMAPGGTTGKLDQQRDCLANIDVFGRPVPCARFMGGREFEILCAGTQFSNYTARDVMQLLQAEVLALPAFVDAGGPFPGHTGEVAGLDAGLERLRPLLASLYLALVADVALDLIGARAEVIIEGPACKNVMFCRALAALRDGQVFICREEMGATLGGAALAFLEHHRLPGPELDAVTALERDALRTYRAGWREAIARRAG